MNRSIAIVDWQTLNLVYFGNIVGSGAILSCALYKNTLYLSPKSNFLYEIDCSN